MPREVNGVQSIIRDAARICRMVERFGTADLLVWTDADYVAAVTALSVACRALEAIDDYVGKVDRTTPGYRDGVPS